MNSGHISVIPSDQLSREHGEGGLKRGGFRNRQTDSCSRPPLVSSRDTDAALLFWEVDSSEEFLHESRNIGAGGSGTSAVTTM